LWSYDEEFCDFIFSEVGKFVVADRESIGRSCVDQIVLIVFLQEFFESLLVIKCTFVGLAFSSSPLVEFEQFVVVFILVQL
jgi:hypothetical protein